MRFASATKNASRQVKICVSPARNHGADLGRSVILAQGHKKRVSGGQNSGVRERSGKSVSHFVVGGRQGVVGRLFFLQFRIEWDADVQGVLGNLPGRSKFAFRLRETPKNASPEVSGGQNLLFDYPARVSSKIVMYECPTRVSSKSVPQECHVRVSSKIVK